MNERIGDIIYNIAAMPFGIHRVRASGVVTETIEKRKGWIPQLQQATPHKNRYGETVEQTDKEFVFTKPT